MPHGNEIYVETREEAFKFMLHHLKLAAMYFELGPFAASDRGELWRPKDEADLAQPAHLLWVRTMEGIYNDLQDDG